ncbi:thiamine pyrophosphate-binding protein [Ornithinimicrobium cryptoxanthini]|uniref:Thiamine pyrophosphate-binding protein n=1 Tax=Ornithinimicrobium cryptoxanthini TaxID=2934161 RepID=A0ABY4YNV3_9MICO|nr:thiamine pyrophosphate-dependent enzyme [Ornithinimicrobium cryptoxanthini]USQ77817.1 thiamine pyrophosphate-binding protein [Ornithinimicrobium cryptoxanthini]
MMPAEHATGGDRNYEVIAKRLHGELADSPLYILAGDANMKLIHACMWEGMRCLSARHENAAVSMAVGYAKGSGLVGVASTTQGPGLTNAATSIVAAVRSRLPVVLLCGAAPGSVPDHPQQLDQTRFLEACGALVLSAGDGVDPGTLVSRALETARTQRTLVAVSMPSDWQERAPSNVHMVPVTGTSPGMDVEAAEVLGDTATQDQVEKIASSLLAAERSLILVGRGAVNSESAMRDLHAVAERTGSIVATTLPCHGAWGECPRAVGVIGGYALPEAHAMFKELDIVLAVGASLGYRTTKYGSLFGEATEIVQVDHAETSLGRYTPVSSSVLSDSGGFAEALRKTIEARAHPGSGYDWGIATGKFLSQARSGVIDSKGGTESGESKGEAQWHPSDLMRALGSVLPTNRAIVVDGGHCSGYPPIYLDVPDGKAFYYSLEFGSIALGLGAAMGMAVARPDLITTLVIGDGSLMMSLGELESAARQKIPILVVLIDDGGYGAERHILHLNGLTSEEISDFDNPEFVPLARALGVHAMNVSSKMDMSRFLDQWLAENSGRPGLMVCNSDPAVRGEWLSLALDR